MFNERDVLIDISGWGIHCIRPSCPVMRTTCAHYVYSVMGTARLLMEHRSARNTVRNAIGMLSVPCAAVVLDAGATSLVMAVQR